MTGVSASLVRPTLVTRVAVRLIVLTILISAGFILSHYADLPWLLPVHFWTNGAPNGWQYRTPIRVLMPVLVQLALAITQGAIVVLLLSRGPGEGKAEGPDVLAAAVAAEAVTLMALIWVAFQGYAAVALVSMWTAQRAGLGFWYVHFELLGIVLTIVVALRAHLTLGRPVARPYVPEHWRFGQLYKNQSDPALFVPTRDGRHWTLNFGRPVAAALLAVAVAIGILGPTVILTILLRSS
jgi:uncharacterized membrane protein